MYNTKYFVILKGYFNFPKVGVEILGVGGGGAANIARYFKGQLLGI